MKERCIITDRCFTDEFDLPLREESTNDFYAAAEIQREVEERILKLAMLSDKYVLSTESIIKYDTTIIIKSSFTIFTSNQESNITNS